MKLVVLAMSLGTLAVGWMAVPGESQDVIVVIGGDVHGYLSPCGCTKPMSGGIRRRTAAVRAATNGKRSLILETGGLVDGLGRQDEIKAETIAEALKQMGCDAIHLTTREAAMGAGVIDSVARLSGAPFVTGSVANEAGLPSKEFIEHEGIVVTGISLKADAIARDLRDRANSPDDAIEAIAARTPGKPLVVLFEGSESEARRLAETHKEISLVVFNALGDPPSAPIDLGGRLLVTPGEKGKSAIRLRFRNGAFQDYSVIKLGPEVTDDPRAAQIYDRYLERVTSEKLLERLPRKPGPKFAGNPTCGTCHVDAMLTWEKSRHAGALHSLEVEKHGRDPDCVRCHVVGLESEEGFRSRRETPHLTDVGCESCHGPGREHSLDPNQNKMAPVGQAPCLACHDRENSPSFDFEAYWKKIAH